MSAVTHPVQVLHACDPQVPLHQASCHAKSADQQKQQAQQHPVTVFAGNNRQMRQQRQTLPCHQHASAMLRVLGPAHGHELRKPLVPICGGLQMEASWPTANQKL